MADGEAPGRPRAGGGIAASWNRLPTGGKAAVLVGGAAIGFLAVRWYKNRKSASSSAAGTTLQVTGPSTPYDPGAAGAGFSGGGGFGPPFPTGLGGSTQTPQQIPDPAQTPAASSIQPATAPTILQSPAGTPIPNSAPIIGATTSQGWSGLPPAGTPIYSYTASQVPGAASASPTSEWVPGFGGVADPGGSGQLGGYLPPGAVIQGPGIPIPMASK